MNKKQIKLSSDEFWPLLNILNEVCHGIKINNFEKSIGVEEQIVVDFMHRIKNEEKKDEALLILDDSELKLLNNSFEEVFKEIEEWEFEMRISITIQEARAIQKN